MQPITHLHHHRAPRATVDSVASQPDALAVIAMAVHRPMRYETIVLALDDARRGRALLTVTGTTQPDSLLDIVELVVHGVYRDSLGGLVVATVRPGEVAPDALDVDRWLEASDIATNAGVELVEWFVIGNEVRCPRDDLGEVPRW